MQDLVHSTQDKNVHPVTIANPEQSTQGKNGSNMHTRSQERECTILHPMTYLEHREESFQFKQHNQVLPEREGEEEEKQKMKKTEYSPIFLSILS